MTRICFVSFLPSLLNIISGLNHLHVCLEFEVNILGEASLKNYKSINLL